MKFPTKHVVIVFCLIIVALRIGLTHQPPANNMLVNVTTQITYPVRFYIDWDKFIEINGAKVLPLGRKIIIPVVVTEAYKWRNATVMFRISDAHKFKEQDIGDFSEVALLKEVRSHPVWLYIPITIRADGAFSLMIDFDDHKTVRGKSIQSAEINVFAFEGQVAFSSSFAEDEIIRQNYQKQQVEISPEVLEQERNKLHQRYLSKYPSNS